MVLKLTHFSAALGDNRIDTPNGDRAVSARQVLSGEFTVLRDSKRAASDTGR